MSKDAGATESGQPAGDERESIDRLCHDRWGCLCCSGLDPVCSGLRTTSSRSGRAVKAVLPLARRHCRMMSPLWSGARRRVVRPSPHDVCCMGRENRNSMRHFSSHGRYARHCRDILEVRRHLLALCFRARTTRPAFGALVRTTVRPAPGGSASHSSSPLLSPVHPPARPGCASSAPRTACG